PASEEGRDVGTCDAAGFPGTSDAPEVDAVIGHEPPHRGREPLGGWSFPGGESGRTTGGRRRSRGGERFLGVRARTAPVGLRARFARAFRDRGRGRARAFGAPGLRLRSVSVSLVLGREDLSLV